MSLKSLPAVLGLASALTLGTALPALALPAAATSDVNVRECGSSRCRIVDVLHEGDRVDVQFCKGVWCAIRHPGRDGFVHANYLAPEGDVDEDDFADLRRRPDRRVRDEIVIVEDDDFFHDDDFFDDDFFFERRRFVRRFNPFFGACIGGPDAVVCISD